MNPIFAVLMTVAEEGKGGLEGRTLLQKKLYFLSTLMDEDFQFRPHYYGPYSEAVADAADSLVNSGFLAESTAIFQSSNNVFGEGRRYSYSLTEDGKRLLDKVKTSQGFEKWRDALQRINSCDISKDFNLLSIAAKMHFIVSEHGKASAKGIRERGHSLGWQISEQDIEKVAKDLEILDLVAEVSH